MHSWSDKATSLQYDLPWPPKETLYLTTKGNSRLSICVHGLPSHKHVEQVFEALFITMSVEFVSWSGRQHTWRIGDFTKWLARALAGGQLQDHRTSWLKDCNRELQLIWPDGNMNLQHCALSGVRALPINCRSQCQVLTTICVIWSIAHDQVERYSMLHLKWYTGMLTHGQKWSNSSTHLSVIEQCLALRGLTILQLTHNWLHLPAHNAGESNCLYSSSLSEASLECLTSKLAPLDFPVLYPTTALQLRIELLLCYFRRSKDQIKQVYWPTADLAIHEPPISMHAAYPLCLYSWAHFTSHACNGCIANFT